VRGQRGQGRRLSAGLGAVVLLAAVALGSASDAPEERFETVVLDAGHGGDDEGARGPAGGLEKDVVLEVVRRLAAALREGGARVVLTRDSDVFVSLEQRTNIANDARGDLFLSIHANAARDAEVRGTETFFLSLEATDEAAHRLAQRENQALGEVEMLRRATDDPLVAILGDMIASEHLHESQAFARMAQERLGAAGPGGSRGVKQAPFVVLSGVQMPASLVEIGFITNSADERRLRSARGQRRIVAALAEAVHAFGRRYDARRGHAPPPAHGQP
jgi:N-acetylmuramoyl-L-alanine amidase